MAKKQSQKQGQAQIEKKSDEILAVLKGLKCSDTVMILHTVETKISAIREAAIIT
jgi:hypothetical protein